MDTNAPTEVGLSSRLGLLELSKMLRMVTIPGRLVVGLSKLLAEGSDNNGLDLKGLVLRFTSPAAESK